MSLLVFCVEGPSEKALLECLLSNSSLSFGHLLSGIDRMIGSLS